MITLSFILFSLSETVIKADSFFWSMNYDSAKVYYTKALIEDSTSYYDVHWKLARLYCNIGDVLNKKDNTESMYDMALKHADKAISEDSTRYEGYVWKSAALGDKALFLGGKKKIEYAFLVKDNAEKALRLNPQCALCYFILGEYQREAATLGSILRRLAKTLYGKVPEGTLDSSLVLLSKAIKLDSTEIKYYLGRGKTYMKMKAYDLAKKDFNRVLSLKEKYQVDRKYKKEARYFLKKLK